MNTPEAEPPKKAWKTGLGIFVAASLLIHAVIVAAVLFYPSGEKREGRAGAAPYIVRIIKLPPAGLLPTPPQPPAPRGGRSGRPSAGGGAAAPEEAPHGSAGVSGEPAPSNVPLPAEPGGPVASLPPSPSPPSPSPSAREMLRDREAIEEAIRREERPPARRDGAVTFDSRELMYRNYLDRLRAHIEGIWKYPPEAARRGVYGDLYITFVIRKDGTLGSVKLERTSGHAALDEAAMRALRDSAPFWPLPAEWGQESFTVNGHFIYTLHGARYIR